MKVLVIVKATKNSEAGGAPSEKMLAEMGAFNDQLVKAGILLAVDGLESSAGGKRIQFSGSSRKIIDGPFTETKELVAGFWIWQVRSIEEAVEWARRCPDPHPGEDSELEIRRIVDLSDLLTPEQEARVRLEAERLNKKS